MYVTPEIATQRLETRRALAARPGERVLDIGVGPGFLAAELAGDVTPGGAVVGVDVSEAMLELAARRSAALELHVADCTALPFADASFDAAVSIQVYEYVADVAGALAELARVLRPGGRAVVVDTDAANSVWKARDEERSARVLSKWAGHAPHPHLPAELPALLAAAGLTVRDSTIVPITHDSWDESRFGPRLADLVVDYVSAHGIEPEEAQAWREDLRTNPDYAFRLERSFFVVTR